MKRLIVIFLVLVSGCSTTKNNQKQPTVIQPTVIPLVNQDSMNLMRYYNNCSVVFQTVADISRINGEHETSKAIMGFQRGAKIVANNLLWIEYMRINRGEIESLVSKPSVFSELVEKSNSLAEYNREVIIQNYAAVAETNRTEFYKIVYHDLEQCMSNDSLKIQESYLNFVRGFY